MDEASVQTQGGGSHETRQLFRAWAAFAAAALALAALLVVPAAVHSALGGDPVLNNPSMVRLLVGHVFFALVIGCMAFQAVLWLLSVLWVEGARFPVLPGWAGFGLVAAGSGLALISTLGHWGQPALTDFVPVVMEPLFLGGLGLAGLGFAATIICFIFAITTAQIERMPLVPFAMLCSALIVVGAALGAVASLARLFGDWFAFQLVWREPYMLAQALFWGPGHLIAFSVAAAMALSWILLMPSPGLNEKEQRMARRGFLVLVIFSAIVLVTLYAVDPLALPKLTMLNAGIRGFLTLPILFVGSLVLYARIRSRRKARNPALFLSTALFGVGLLMAPIGVIAKNQTWIPEHFDALLGRAVPAHFETAPWVPGHFEAVILGAVLVAFMGVATDIIPLWERTLTSLPLARLQSYLYSIGILLVSVGNFWAAFGGGERHGYFIQISSTGPLVMVWVGGIIAELGVMAFVANTFGALFMRAPAPAEHKLAAASDPLPRPT